MSEFVSPSENLLFRVYMHGKDGYVTVTMDRFATLVELKRTALKCFARLQKAGETSEEETTAKPVSDTNALNDAKINTEATEVTTAAETITISEVPEATCEATGDKEGEYKPTTKTSGDNKDEDSNANLYFARILSSHTTNFFKEAIQLCLNDDEALYTETKQWIMGQDDKTLIYAVYDQWLDRITGMKEEEKKKSSKKKYFSRSSSDPPPVKPFNTAINEKKKTLQKSELYLK